MTRTAIPLALLTALLTSCQSSSPPPQEEEVDLPVRVENEQLKLAIADVPDVFELESNSGAELRLRRAGEEMVGFCWVEVGEEGGNVNLVEIVNRQRESYEGQAGGSFSGSRELMMADGRPGYYSRGRFLDGDVEVEEFRLFSLHPIENRLLTIFYRYPAGTDSADRLNDLLLVAGELEGFDAGTTEAGS